MWNAVFAFLNGLLSAFNTWQISRQRDADRQAGRDEAFNRAQWEILDVSAKAKDIEERIAAMDDVELNSLLKRPENRD